MPRRRGSPRRTSSRQQDPAAACARTRKHRKHEAHEHASRPAEVHVARQPGQLSTWGCDSEPLNNVRLRRGSLFAGGHRQPQPQQQQPLLPLKDGLHGATVNPITSELTGTIDPASALPACSACNGMPCSQAACDSVDTSSRTSTLKASLQGYAIGRLSPNYIPR